jgi:hypothetical protein
MPSLGTWGRILIEMASEEELKFTIKVERNKMPMHAIAMLRYSLTK